MAPVKPMARRDGFSLVELMIVIAIMAILLSLGIPVFATYFANLKVRTTAEGFLSGLQLARADAVRRNGGVEFLLTNDAPTELAAANANGINWVIRSGATLIEGKSGAEGSSSTEGGASPVQVVGSVASITFNGLGGTNLAAPATFQFSNSAAGACAPVGPIRCLNVIVAPGGRIKQCDPAAAGLNDTRSC